MRKNAKKLSILQPKHGVTLSVKVGYIAITLFFAMVCGLLQAQIEQNVQQPDTLYLGSKFVLSIKSQLQLEKAVIPDTLTRFAVVDVQKYKPGRRQYGLKLTIQTHDTGEHTFPSLIIQTTKPTNGTLRTEPVTLVINETRSPDDSTLVDIAPPLKVWGELPVWAYYVIGILLVIVFLIMLIYIIRKYIKRNVRDLFASDSSIDNRTNAQKTLDLLYTLRAERLPEACEFITFHFRLSELMKQFLEAEYHFSANEMTTSEIRNYIRKNKIFSSEQQRTLNKWLEECDKVKFAKYIPSLDKCYEKLDWFEHWLNELSAPKSVEAEEETESV